MSREIVVPCPGRLLKLLEYYALGCIGHLPVERERKLERRIHKTYHRDSDWKSTLRWVLKIDAESDTRLLAQWQACELEARQFGRPLDAEQFVRARLEDIFPKLARPQRIVLPEYRQTGPIILKAIGFWQDNDGGFVIFPKPQSLVREGWHAAELGKILSYLGSGYCFVANGGWSTCRFNCKEGEYNGCGNFTDGEWLWPEGLGHYIARHAVALPEELIETMKRNDWKLPDVADLVPPGMWKWDHSFWLEWARINRTR